MNLKATVLNHERQVNTKYEYTDLLLNCFYKSINTEHVIDCALENQLSSSISITISDLDYTISFIATAQGHATLTITVEGQIMFNVAITARANIDGKPSFQFNTINISKEDLTLCIEALIN